MPKMISQYIADIKSAGGKMPRKYEPDPVPMQICKLSDALRKAGG